MFFILIVIMFWFTLDHSNDEGFHPKCKKGCRLAVNSPYCGKKPCQKGECPFYCDYNNLDNTEFCSYTYYGKNGDPDVDCSGCGCRKPNGGKKK